MTTKAPKPKAKGFGLTGDEIVNILKVAKKLGVKHLDYNGVLFFKFED